MQVHPYPYYPLTAPRARLGLRPTSRHAGFSLVEVMVGMVIGLLGMVVMLQLFSVFEGQKRATTGGSEAQNSGAIALYGLQRAVEKSGYGLSAYRMIGCNMTLAATTNRGVITINNLAPVVINHAAIPAGDANTDTLLIAYGNTNSPPEGDGVTAQPSQPNYAVQTPTSFLLEDRVLAQVATRPSPCTLIMEKISGLGNPNVTVATGIASMSGGTLYNVGNGPKLTAYAIRNSTLMVCEYVDIVFNAGGATTDNGQDCGNAALIGVPTVWVPIASNIVSLRAQYGHDTRVVTAPPTYIVDSYDQTTPATACGWVRSPAIRMALVVGNDQFNKTAVTSAAPVWGGSATTPIVLTALANTFAGNWQNYRYKMFEAVIPLRNLTWQGGQAGC